MCERERERERESGWVGGWGVERKTEVGGTEEEIQRRGDRQKKRDMKKGSGGWGETEEERERYKEGEREK